VLKAEIPRLEPGASRSATSAMTTKNNPVSAAAEEPTIT
jgi:hypothetical protein